MYTYISIAKTDNPEIHIGIDNMIEVESYLNIGLLFTEI
jgi:hypothetical protein